MGYIICRYTIEQYIGKYQFSPEDSTTFLGLYTVNRQEVFILQYLQLKNK